MITQSYKENPEHATPGVRDITVFRSYLDTSTRELAAILAGKVKALEKFPSNDILDGNDDEQRRTFARLKRFEREVTAIIRAVEAYEDVIRALEDYYLDLSSEYLKETALRERLEIRIIKTDVHLWKARHGITKSLTSKTGDQ